MLLWYVMFDDVRFIRKLNVLIMGYGVEDILFFLLIIKN